MNNTLDRQQDTPLYLRLMHKLDDEVIKQVLSYELYKLLEYYGFIDKFPTKEELISILFRLHKEDLGLVFEKNTYFEKKPNTLLKDILGLLDESQVRDYINNVYADGSKEVQSLETIGPYHTLEKILNAKIFSKILAVKKLKNG